MDRLVRCRCRLAPPGARWQQRRHLQPWVTTHSLSVFVDYLCTHQGHLFIVQREHWPVARLIFTELRSLWPHWMLAKTGSSPSRCNRHLHGIYGQCCHLKGQLCRLSRVSRMSTADEDVIVSRVQGERSLSSSKSSIVKR
jgi:hypothetical protein